MDRKKLLLILIVVGVLVIAIAGASFAYFTASTTNSGSGEIQDITTTTVGNVSLTMGATTTTNVLQYPGGYLVVGASVTGKHTGDTAYNTTYTVNGTITNETSTALTWNLYEVSAPVSSPVSGCEVKESAASGETQYTYEGCTVSTSITGGTKVTSGTVAANGNGLVTATGETLTTTNAGKVTYYYLVVNYPDTGKNQNTDQNKTISASLTNISNGTAATK